MSGEKYILGRWLVRDQAKFSSQPRQNDNGRGKALLEPSPINILNSCTWAKMSYLLIQWCPVVFAASRAKKASSLYVATCHELRMPIKFSSLPSNSQRTQILECLDQVESTSWDGASSKMSCLGPRLFGFLISRGWVQADWLERPGMKVIVVDMNGRLDSVTVRVDVPGCSRHLDSRVTEAPAILVEIRVLSWRQDAEGWWYWSICIVLHIHDHQGLTCRDFWGHQYRDPYYISYVHTEAKDSLGAGQTLSDRRIKSAEELPSTNVVAAVPRVKCQVVCKNITGLHGNPNFHVDLSRLW